VTTRDASHYRTCKTEFVLSARHHRAEKVQHESTATSPHNRQPMRSPTSLVSWDDDQTTRSAASSGRRGCARCVQQAVTGGARLLHDEAYLTSDVTLYGVTTGPL
jgi:hypothetical protein